MKLKYDYKVANNDYKGFAYWLIFRKDELLVSKDGESFKILNTSDISMLDGKLSDVHYIGSFDEKDCYVANLCCKELPGGFSAIGLRQIFNYDYDGWFSTAFRAFHILNWVKKTKFCSSCGEKLYLLEEERAMKCANCGHITYPRISPAVIMAVVKGDEILLARSGRFTTEMYSVIAGFVEPGEKLEECVKREVREEVGIEVDNIKYFGNQPWPFPDSLMIGFTAEYKSGEIIVDNKEIVDAKWYTASNLPQIPGQISIARQLIDWFVKSRQ